MIELIVSGLLASGACAAEAPSPAPKTMPPAGAEAASAPLPTAEPGRTTSLPVRSSPPGPAADDPRARLFASLSGDGWQPPEPQTFTVLERELEDDAGVWPTEPGAGGQRFDPYEAIGTTYWLRIGPYRGPGIQVNATLDVLRRIVRGTRNSRIVALRLNRIPRDGPQDTLLTAKPSGENTVTMALAGGRSLSAEVLETHPLRIAPRPSRDPLLLDLDRNGVATLPASATFDLDSDGVEDVIHEFGPGDALLVFDSDGDGVSGEDGREVFGDYADIPGRWKTASIQNGFEALDALVEQAESEAVLPKGVAVSGVLDAGALAALEKRYGLAVRIGRWKGPTKTLSAAGVSSIQLGRGGYDFGRNVDGRLTDRLVRRGAKFLRTDGSAGELSDLWLSSAP